MRLSLEYGSDILYDCSCVKEKENDNYLYAQTNKNSKGVEIG